jgi:hypothetical protein
VVESQLHGRTPTLRWYSLEQALALLEAAGFSRLSATRESTFEPARPNEPRFKIVGVRA